MGNIIFTKILPRVSVIHVDHVVHVKI